MRKVTFLFIAIGFSLTLSAQRINIKNNLLGDATLSPNLALEFGLGKKTTFEIYGSYNPFILKKNIGSDGSGERKFKHWLAQPEFRYWICERFNGMFFGAHALGGEFNVADLEHYGIMKFTKDRRYEGFLIGGGLTFGNQWVLGKRFSLELAIGLGYAYIDYDVYDCAKCGDRIKYGSYHYVGPTRTVASFVYFFR